MRMLRWARCLYRVGFAMAGGLLVCTMIVHAGTTTYTYDNAGRLNTATYHDGSKVVFTLDAAGNRTTVSGTGPINDTIPPSVPTGLSATAAGYTQVNLSWNASTDNPGGSGVQGYRVYRAGTLLGTTSATTYSDTSVNPGVSYSYTVLAFDAAGNSSAQSGAVSVTTPLPAPTGLTATLTISNTVVLSWNASSGAAGYRIFRGGSQIATTGATTYTDSSVAGGTTYSYTVQAYSSAGATSGQSGAASISTANSDTLSMVQGYVNYAAPPFTGVIEEGYNAGTIGQLTPTTLTGGMTVTGFYKLGSSGFVTYLVVSGFSADPGSAWLSSVTFKGTTSGASQATYSYGSGAASWEWAGDLGFDGASTTPVTIAHH